MRFVWPAAALVALAAPAAHAAAPSFSASIDRAAVAPDQAFVYRVTLSSSQGEPDNFRPPDFRGLQVVGGPFTQTGFNMTMGGGGTQVQSNVTWSYQLTLPAGAKGPVTIGAAHVNVGGQNLASNTVVVRVGAAAPGAQAPQRPQRPSLFPRSLFGDEPDVEEPRSSSTANAVFLRAVADKTRAYVGEQVTVTWYLYLAQPQSHFQQLTQPKTDGFWSEEIPSTNPPGQLAFTDRDEGGQRYQVATILQRALFPLAPGKLTVSSIEAEVAQADFFGRAIRPRRLKSEAIAIEALALPRQGQDGSVQPAHFPTSNVGHFTFDVTVDRPSVPIGDAVTLTMTVAGNGNVRNVALPDLPTLPGWKGYEPKTNVVMQGGTTASGSKTVEWLIRPERPGQTVIPALTFVSFDPAEKRYVESNSKPIELTVTGDAGVAAAGQPMAAGPAAGGLENVIAAEIRPIRARAVPSRSVGASFLRGAGFKLTLLTPPFAFVALAFVGRVRDRLSRDERRTSRRRLRSIARRRLHAAAGHRDAGRAAAFYVEIERVLRETLSEKLRVPVGGLRSEELGALLGARGLPAAEVTRLQAVLAACDEARFSPGGEPAGRPAQDAMLDEAAALIDLVEKAPLATGGTT
jgi:oxygen tolerance protein BatD